MLSFTTRLSGCTVARRCIWIRAALCYRRGHGRNDPDTKGDATRPTISTLSSEHVCWRIPRRCVAIKSSFPQPWPSVVATTRGEGQERRLRVA